MIITIDGPAGTGKSTVAKKVAEALKFVFFDTGAMYRAVTYAILQHHIDLGDHNRLSLLLMHFPFRITDVNGKKHYWVDQIDVTEQIRSQEVTKSVSEVSALPLVRKALLHIQRSFARSTNSVFEGRDMGSTVFPHADLKVYLDANPEVRAERRFLELKQKSLEKKTPFSLTVDEILSEINERDRIDSSRECSPLVQPEGSFYLDTSHLSIEEVTQKILNEAKKRGIE